MVIRNCLGLCLLSILLVTCCPCNQYHLDDPWGEASLHHDNSYVPSALDSLLLFDAWEGRSCLALDSFFQMWESQSHAAMAQVLPPDDTLQAVYDLFEALVAQPAQSSKSKYLALQDSVPVLVVDSPAFAAIRSLSFESLYDYSSKSCQKHQFRYPRTLGKPILCGYADFHQALNFLFVGNGKTRLAEVEDLDWDMVFSKSRFLEPYLEVRPNHWGLSLLTHTDPIITSVILNDQLAVALVGHQSWGCGGTIEFVRTDSGWVKSRDLHSWIE